MAGGAGWGLGAGSGRVDKGWAASGVGVRGRRLHRRRRSGYRIVPLPGVMSEDSRQGAGAREAGREERVPVVSVLDGHSHALAFTGAGWASAISRWA